MDLYIHMQGSSIGALNIYQAPVVGFAVKKLSLTTAQGQNWVKKQIQFDSNREFQVSISRCVFCGFSEDYAPRGFRPDKTRAARFLNGFKNIPGKACVKRVHNNDAFVNVGS